MSDQATSLIEHFKRNDSCFPWTVEGLNCFEYFAGGCLVPKNVKASKFYRRFKDRYVSPRGFNPWAQEMAKIAALTTPLYFQTQFCAYRGEIYPRNEQFGRFLGATVHSYFYKSPAFYISEEMVKALANTVVPPMAEPKKVIESFYLVLPKTYASKIGFDQTTVSTVILAQTGKAHKKGLEVANRLFNVAIQYPSYALQPSNPDNAGIHCFACGANMKKGELWADYLEGFWNKEYKTGGDDNGRWLINIMKNIVLLHNYDQKRFMTEEKPRQQTAGRGFQVDSLKAQYPITWIGKNYKRQRAKQKPTDSSQTKRIFKSHWRKGHWHHFWAGQGRKQKILKWVQPVYVKGVNLHS